MDSVSPSSSVVFPPLGNQNSYSSTSPLLSDSHSSPSSSSSLQSEFHLLSQREYYHRVILSLRTKCESTVKLLSDEISALRLSLTQSETESKFLRGELHRERGEVSVESKKQIDKLQNLLDEKDKQLEKMKISHKENTQKLLSQHSVTLQSLRDSFESKMSDLKNSHKSKLSEISSRSSLLVSQYEEALKQQDDEWSFEYQKMKFTLENSLQKSRESNAQMLSEMSNNKRKVEESASIKTQFEFHFQEEKENNSQLTNIIKRITEELSVSQSENIQKDEEITRCHLQLLSSRQDIGTMKSFIDMLENKILEIEERELPTLEIIKKQNVTQQNISEEIHSISVEKQFRESQLIKKCSEIHKLNSQINLLRRKLTQNDSFLSRLHGELKFIFKELANSNLPVAQEFRRIFQQYFKDLGKEKEGTGEEEGKTTQSMFTLAALSSSSPSLTSSSSSSVSDLHDSYSSQSISRELERQRFQLEKNIKNLEKTNLNLKAQSHRLHQSHMRDNIHFLSELNEMKIQSHKEKKQMEKQIENFYKQNSQKRKDKLAPISPKDNVGNTNGNESEISSTVTAPIPLPALTITAPLPMEKGN